MPKFLSVGEVANLLGVSEKWVYSHQKEIPGRIKIAGLIRFNQDILLEELTPFPRKAHTQQDRHGLS